MIRRFSIGGSQWIEPLEMSRQLWNICRKRRGRSMIHYSGLGETDSWLHIVIELWVESIHASILDYTVRISAVHAGIWKRIALLRKKSVHDWTPLHRILLIIKVLILLLTIPLFILNQNVLLSWSELSTYIQFFLWYQ